MSPSTEGTFISFHVSEKDLRTSCTIYHSIYECLITAVLPSEYYVWYKYERPVGVPSRFCYNPPRELYYFRFPG